MPTRRAATTASAPSSRAARLAGNRLENVQVLFRQSPKGDRGQHFGGRIVFDRAGYLYLTLGDRGEMARAQRPDDHAGSVIRLHDDGRVPQDNPFVGKPGWKPEKFTLGNRNMQGAALHPQTGVLWTHEHGPQGGDEINVIRAGANYGWPVITYGVNYGIGTKIGEGTRKDGMAQPLHYWVPSIAPSGMAFYTGDKFPNWKGDLFVGALRDQMLVRLQLDGEKVVKEERLLKGVLGRIRDVRMGPDGFIYVVTDESTRRGRPARAVVARLSAVEKNPATPRRLRRARVALPEAAHRRNARGARPADRRQPGRAAGEAGQRAPGERHARA